jgi:hypothetical protein
MKLHSTLASVWLLPPAAGGEDGPLLCGAPLSEVWDGVRQAHAAVLAVPTDDRVPRVVPVLPEPSAIKWTRQLHLCQLAQGSSRSGAGAGADSATTVNVMAQSWLFDAELDADPDRIGISRWPFVGVLGEVGLLPPSATAGRGMSSCEGDVRAAEIQLDAPDVADVGFGGRFAPTDQHTHLVKEVLDLDGHLLELSDW